jgi:lysine 2,3-aminomutase
MNTTESFREAGVECEKDGDKPPGTGTVTMDPVYGRTEFVNGNTLFAARVDSSRWNDWRWQMRHRIRTVAQLRNRFPDLADLSAIEAAAARYPMAITPYYASLVRTLDGSDPVFQMAVPSLDELVDPPYLAEDPLEEEADMPVPGLIHRYRDRALVMTTATCAMYCRHCTRKRVAGQHDSHMSAPALRRIVAYLRAHPEVHDVIVSGGDPLTLPTALLARILESIRQVPSVDIIRIGTRVPVVMPMRVTSELTDMLRRFHPLYVNTHFNHPAEITPQSAEACERLADVGIPLGNQSVLLRGVNDDAPLLADLFRKLLRHRVRPYYLFQCDLVRGIERFRTPLSRGMEIMEYLRGRLSGLGIPAFVVDTPHGGGKIPLTPHYIVSQSPTHTALRNFEGMIVSYPEPTPVAGLAERRPCTDTHATGVWDVVAGRRECLVPDSAARQRRSKTEERP